MESCAWPRTSKFNSPKSKFLSEFPTQEIEPGFEIHPLSPQPPQGDCKSWDTSFHHAFPILIIYVHGGFQWKPIKSYLSANYHNNAVRESRWRKGYTSPHSKNLRREIKWLTRSDRAVGDKPTIQSQLQTKGGIAQAFPGNPDGKASHLEGLDLELPQFCSQMFPCRHRSKPHAEQMR